MGRKVGRGTGDTGGELGKQENESRKNSSAQLRMALHQRGFVVKTAEEGGKETKALNFPKRLNRDFCVSFRHYPK